MKKIKFQNHIVYREKETQHENLLHQNYKKQEKINSELSSF